MKFIDNVKVFLRGGDGGSGCLSFRRERFRPKGGPDGGDGGKGGDVVFVSDVQVESLIHLLYHPHLVAENGQRGRQNRQSGRSGKDLLIRVPVGTRLIDPETDHLLDDLDTDQKRFVAARGGRGGRGNAQFATAVERTPRRFEKGKRGEEGWLRLDLRLLVDVGLVGPPNTGKSSLIARISSVRPRIADYPFTTTSPNLGVVRGKAFTSFVVADTPGLIENASRGAGLGTGFLKHIERAVLLVYVLDISRLPNRTPIEDYETTVTELRTFDRVLGKKKEIAAINKVDLLESPDVLTQFERAFADRGISTFSVSALTGQGISELVGELSRHVNVQESLTAGRNVIER
jgi:GTP-binding protein